jgi:mono/diheme cytochrome c family protein
MRSAFGGTGFLSDGNFNAGTRNTPLGDPKAGLSSELDALAAYVASLSETAPSPYKSPGGALTPEGVRGKAVFKKQNCAQCHTGSSFTDSLSGALHNVGTLKSSSGQRLGGPLPGIDTPTLKGLWDTAPYFHDGSADTLLDVMNDASAPQHGGMDQLTAGEKSDLAAYLLQIDDAEGLSVAAEGSASAALQESPRRLLSMGRSDGVNDVIDFGPSATAVEVIDGRGRRVYRSEVAPVAWDGRVGGRPAASGVYFARVTRGDGSVRHQKILVVR